MGTIMTAVAVLLTHMVMNQLANIKPKTICAGLVPTVSTVSSAKRRCKFQRCVAKPSSTPPKTRKTMLWA